MCGIVGIISNKPVAEDIFKGLKAIEYRGYDSAGIALQGPFEVFKSLGQIQRLTKIVKAARQTIGIGHTRWATHGIVSLQNTHPISIRCSAIVHNGIMENASFWKQKLGYKPKGETDTEIMLALFESLYEKNKNEMEALQQLCALAEGSFAIAIMLDDEKIFWAKKGLSPLVLGEFEDGRFVGSDIESLQKDAEIYDINDGFGFISRASQNIFKNDFSKRSYKFEMLETINETNTIMESEILQQPKIWKEMLDFEALKLQKDLMLIGCGSAYIAACIGALWFEEAGISARAEIASEWALRKSFGQGEIILISQSGETADTIAALLKAQDQGKKIYSLLNKENSTIGRKSDVVIPIKAGVEKSVASTKAFTAQLIRLYQIVFGSIEPNLPRLGEDVLKIDISKIAKILSKSKRIIIIGRNLMHYVALEGALKIKEITYLNAEGYAAGELKHGYLALVDEECYAIVLAPKDEIFYKKTISNAQEIKSRGGKIVLISPGKSEMESDYKIDMPDMDYSISPIVYTVILQKIALKMAEELGKCVDKPRNLAKSITVE